MATVAGWISDAGADAGYVATSGTAWKVMADTVSLLAANRFVEEEGVAAGYTNTVAGLEHVASDAVADAALTRDLADNVSTQGADDSIAGLDNALTVAIIEFQRQRAERDLDADLFADWDRLAANLQANLDLLGSERDARTPQIAAEIRALKARAVADFMMSWAKAILGRALTEVKLALEAPVKLAAARVEILKVVDDALKNRNMVVARDPSYYEYELLTPDKLFNNVLDTATDFSVGWANKLTGGWYVRLLGPTGYIRYVDQTSTAFHAGEIVALSAQWIPSSKAKYTWP